MQRILQYLKELVQLIGSNKLILAILMVISVFVATESLVNTVLSELYLKTFLVVFIITYVIQYLFLLKENYTLYLVRVLAVVLVVLELSLIAVGNLSTTDTASVRIRGEFSATDPVVVWKLRPDIESEKSIQIFQGDTVSVGIYSSDELSRRIRENPDRIITDKIIVESNPEKHAIFVGCSFTFGSGLKYDESFPGYLESVDPGYKAYNYGFKSYGPHHASLLFDSGVNTINRNTILEGDGFMMYAYLDVHLPRVYGGGSESISSPNIFIRNGELKKIERSLFHKLFILFLRSSNTFQFFGIHLEYPKTEVYYKRFADIVNYLSSKYREQFPEGKFYVALYPGYSYDLKWLQYLSDDVHIVDMGVPADYQENFSEYVIHPIVDRHPSGEMNRYFINEFLNMKNNPEEK